MNNIVKTSEKLTKKNIIEGFSDVRGGVSLAISNLVVGKVIPQATPITKPASGLRTVCKQAIILAGSTTTVYLVESATNLLKVGEFLGVQTGGLAYAITDITDNGDGTDSVTVGTALESATEGAFLYEMAAESATTTSALKNEADTILKFAFEIPVTSTLVYLGADAYIRADVLEEAVGSEYLATMKGIIVEY